MPPRLIDTAIRDALARGNSIYDADVDALVETDLLHAVIGALAEAGLDVRIRGQRRTLRRLRLRATGTDDGRVQADHAVDSDRLRFVLRASGRPLGCDWPGTRSALRTAARGRTH